MNLHLKYILSSKEDSGGISKGFAAAVSVIALFFACLPLFTVNCIQGHDIDYHLLRIEALKTGILNGLPFLRVNMLFFGGEGYASSMFYPDFLLYIPAVLRALGVGINLSYHIFVAFCIIAAFASMYFCVGYITGNRTSALISAVIYTLCQYHIDDIYTRAAVGEFTAFIFLPLIIAGLYDLTERDFKKPALLTVGMAGVLLCHTLTTFFSLIFCFCFVLLNIKGLIKSPSKLIKLIITALITLLLTMFYWLPMLEQLLSASFKYRDSAFDVAYEKLLMTDIFANSAGRMGIALFILLLPALLVRHDSDRLIRFADVSAVSGFIFTLCTTGLFPWKRLADYVSAVQFPWRLFIMAALLLSVAAGIYMEKAALSQKKAAVLIVLSVMLISAVSNFNRTEEGYYSYSDDYYNEVKFTKSVIGGEWLPETVTERDKLGHYADVAFDADGGRLETVRKKNTLTVTGIDSAYVDVPFIYYKGYAAADGNGNALNVDGSGYNGRVRVYTDNAETARVYYKGTALQKAADIVSLITALALIIICLRPRLSKANLKNQV